MRRSVRVSYKKEMCPFCAHGKVVIKPRGKFCTKCLKPNKGIETKKNKFGNEYITPVM